jgi:L-cysteine:1D-myo-inositol 2-amino-2-deoxy-alpha-D-glucopyranoside ligase
VPPLRVFDHASGELQDVTARRSARMYVCGITPYDATHLGHAVTFLAFDLINRVWRDSGLEVRYVQNVTDVDDPLLERAERDQMDWRDLAERETELLREDMTALRILPPTHFVGAVEAIPEIADRVAELLDAGAAYRLDEDVYFSVESAEHFGYESSLGYDAMIASFGENGGDPDRSGKKNRLDPLLWRGRRPDEPWWDTCLGPGRPGWHIECAAIALGRLGMGFEVQGGGRDLIFPHHEMSAAHAEVLTGEFPFAQAYVHAGMVGLDGEKMSKSRGNLVFAHKLREQEPAGAVRLALLDGHYREDRDWTADTLATAHGRLERWRDATARSVGPNADSVLANVRARLCDDLDTVGALAAVDAWVETALTGGGSDPDAPVLVHDLVDALLGVDLAER